jgi:hypothetical protein
MASVLDQLPKSTFSLQGNKFNPKTQTADWGYPDATGQLQPDLSRLQYTYSVDGDPNVRIKDYNRAALGGVTTVRPPARLDELDPKAPNLTPVGVVSQIYKSASGRKYKDLGPQPGRY